MLFYENTVQGTFLRRLNRFVAEVEIDGKTEWVHVKNTGRLKELLLPGAQICLQRAGDPNRKTAYDLISVYKPGLEWVNIDSLAPNRLMKEYLEQQGYDLVKPEYSYGNSRVDFYMERARTASASFSRTAHGNASRLARPSTLHFAMHSIAQCRRSEAPCALPDSAPRTSQCKALLSVGGQRRFAPCPPSLRVPNSPFE